MKRKLILNIGNDKGGIAKSSSVETAANLLESMGYSVSYLSKCKSAERAKTSKATDQNQTN